MQAWAETQWLLIKDIKCVLTGTQAMTLVKREVESEVDRITKFIKDMSDSITLATQEMVEKVKAHEMTNAAQ